MPAALRDVQQRQLSGGDKCCCEQLQCLCARDSNSKLEQTTYCEPAVIQGWVWSRSCGFCAISAGFSCRDAGSSGDVCWQPSVVHMASLPSCESQHKPVIRLVRLRRCLEATCSMRLMACISNHLRLAWVMLSNFGSGCARTGTAAAFLDSWAPAGTMAIPMITHAHMLQSPVSLT